LLAIVAIALVAGALAASPAFDGLRGLSLDALTALRWRLIGNRHDPSASPAVVIALDRDSYRTPPFKGTPTITWTREIGRLVTAVIDGGARVVGFDLVFPTSIEESEISFNGETVGAQMRGFDRDFLRALALAGRAGKLVLGEVQHGDDLVLPASGQRVAVGQQQNIRSLNVYSEWDGVVRRTPLMLALDGGTVPSMSLELASRALGVAPETSADQSVSLAGYRIPTAVPNAMTLNFDGGSNDIPTYSFADLRECLERGDVDFFRRNFEGKVVLFGSELGFEDGKLTSKRFAATPAAPPAERCALSAGSMAPVVGNSIDGVYIHATAVNNLLRRDAISELAPVPRWLIITAGSAAATLAAFLLTPAGAALSFLLLGLVWTAGATVAFANAIALPLLEPLAAGVVAIVATTGFRLFVTDKDKRFLRRTFELYLAPAVIEKMVSSSRPPVLGGEIRNVTVFFSDLAGFSSIAERMKPAELVALMNRYLSAMTDIIEAHGGFVDKYIGDGIVAVFGAPVEGTDDAAQAVRAALACVADLNKLNDDAASNGPILFQRIGLNSGQALVGNIGSRRRFNYTVMGDSVNLAARLEGANKYFGTSILASEFTVALTGAAFAWREIDAIRVKGRDEPVRIYEPLGEAGRQSADQLTCAASYSEGLALWREREFAGAAQSFGRWAEADPPSALFMARAKKLSLSPPDEDWRPIETLQEK
jgi:class 3 adenylate cyclase/CHASE2 domain-containing sensor protein